MYRAGVILSGCGKKDGTDITEAVMLFLALDRAGVETVCMSIDKDQFEVVNHLEDSTQMSGQKRNMLIESARLARGGIVDLDGAENVDFDILIIPGGKGVLKNLSTFMSEELEFRVNSSVQRIIADSNRRETHRSHVWRGGSTGQIARKYREQSEDNGHRSTERAGSR
jgi:enhancing lycopene biosynthesis protein 2